MRSLDRPEKAQFKTPLIYKWPVSMEENETGRIAGEQSSKRPTKVGLITNPGPVYFLTRPNLGEDKNLNSSEPLFAKTESFRGRKFYIR